jgi:hypothetical protein
VEESCVGAGTGLEGNGLLIELAYGFLVRLH